MKRLLPSLILIAGFSLFQSCVTDGGKSSAGNPDSTLAKNGERKPRIPKVTYRAVDSLVSIVITGSASGEENRYWIHRDGKLLDEPAYQAGNDGSHLYMLVDSLAATGLHTYNVQYGITQDSLSDKSPDYVYEYAGHSPSGYVQVSFTPQQLVRVNVTLTMPDPVKGLLVERREGKSGNEIPLDTLKLGLNPFNEYIDTNLLAEDTMLYYRVRAIDPVTEKLLDASPWDSIQVKNKVWKYIPQVDLRLIDGGVMASVSNPYALAGTGTGFYFLFRNVTNAKDGKVLVDSLPISALFPAAILHDQPEPGDYFYWVEARDPWGRVSARSMPAAVHYSGNPVGPAIANLEVRQASIYVQANSLAEQSYIVERTQDTLKPALAVDTAQLSGLPYLSVIDRPVSDGYYFYRLIALGNDGARSDPGPWTRSGFFHFNPVYGDIAVMVANRGDHVEAHIDKSPSYYYVLCRSKSAAVPESAAVDTLAYSDTSSSLKDAPPVGRWYYRIFRYNSFPSGQDDGTIYRSASTRVDFTGKPVGPAIVSINMLSTGIGFTVAADPEALAFVLERSANGKDWTPADTGAGAGNAYGNLKDVPPADGFWSYRVRTIRMDLAVTDPGAVMRTPTAFASGPRVTYDLYATITNLGTRVECQQGSTFSYIFYLMRGATSDPSKGEKVDSLGYPSTGSALADTPAKGTYYYWVQRVSEFQPDAPIYRAAPVKIEFTGSPEITSLIRTGNAVQVNYPHSAYGDTLDIYRSTGKPDDVKSFTLLASVATGDFSNYYLDNAVGTASGFYHYRLALRSNGKVSDPGPAKSIYYEPQSTIQF